MQQLWAPWRMEYVSSGARPEGCIFCTKPAQDKDGENYILWRGRHTFVIMNIFPYNNGHLMVVPYSHADSLAKLDADTRLELMSVSSLAVEALRKVMKPEGFNVGINLGKAGGAGIAEHLHIHVVPRWGGDTNFMPVLADVRVIPQHLQSTYEQLLPVFEQLAASDRQVGSGGSD